MEENTIIADIVAAIEDAPEAELREVIVKWFEKIRTDGMWMGAQFISATIAGTIKKDLKKGTQSSLRDYQRAIKHVMEIVSGLLKQQDTQQNDLMSAKNNKTEAEI